MITHNTRNWIADTALGLVVGIIFGAIVGINVAIYAGPDDGYESSIEDLLRHHPLTGFAAVVSLVAGPIIGVIVLRRMRHKRTQVPRP